jgi:hypothetical protein
LLCLAASDDNKTTKSYTNWFLEIKNVDVGDIGYYSCEVKDVPGLLQVSLIKLKSKYTRGNSEVFTITFTF